MAKKAKKAETALAVISKDTALNAVTLIKADLKAGRDIIQAHAYNIGQRVQMLKDGNAHTLSGEKSFNDYLDKTFADVGVGHSMLGKYANAYHHLKGTVDPADYTKWAISAVGEVKWGRHDDFIKRINDGTFTPETFTQDMAKAFNKEGETVIEKQFALFDGFNPVETENGIKLMTEEEVKADAPTTNDKSMTVVRFTFKNNMDRKVICYATVNKANLCISKSVFYKEFSSADVKAYEDNKRKADSNARKIERLRKAGFSDAEIADLFGEN